VSVWEWLGWAIVYVGFGIAFLVTVAVLGSSAYVFFSNQVRAKASILAVFVLFVAYFVGEWVAGWAL
jgi:hypothetical protein